MNLSWVNDIYSSGGLSEAPESGPAEYSSSPLAASGEHFSGVFKPLLTERRTKGDTLTSQMTFACLFKFLSGHLQGVRLPGRGEEHFLIEEAERIRWFDEIRRCLRVFVVMLTKLPGCTSQLRPRCDQG